MADLSEAETRKKIIDPQLKDAGWLKTYVKDEVNSLKSNFNTKDYVPFNGEVEKGKDRFIDYLLLGEDNFPLAIIEAKKSSVSFYKGRIQAETYVKDIGIEGLKPPEEICHDRNCAWHGDVRVRGRLFKGVVVQARKKVFFLPIKGSLK